MRPKHLAIRLSKLEPHPCGRLELEQYVTEGDLAAYWMLAVNETDGLYGQHVLDLGAGNGVLGIACLHLGAAHVTFVEADEEAVEVIRRNVAALGPELQPRTKVMHAHLGHDGFTPPEVNLVVTNPPWGTQTPKADRPLLETAFSTTARSVHVLHHVNAQHIEALARANNWAHEHLLRTEFRLPAQYLHHTKRATTTEVMCWRFHRPGDEQLPQEAD